MKRKPHKHAELIKAWADGAEIEFFDRCSERWLPASNLSWGEFFQYRIKPEPKYVPFTWEDREQLRGKWVKRQGIGPEKCIIAFSGGPLDYIVLAGDFWHSFAELFEQYTFLDGSPVGKLV